MRTGSPDALEPRDALAEIRSPRVHHVDWLRALAVLGVFVYHTLRPFTTGDWHVTNGQRSEVADGIVSFVDPWGIAFFFLIAGASSFLALRRRSAGQYVRERLMRLLLPLVVAYVLLSPVQAFIEERHFGRYTGSFVAGVPLFFQEVASHLPGTLLHPLLVDRTYHLWFLVFLLWFSVLGLPLFLWVRASGPRVLAERLGGVAAHRGATLLLGVPIMVPVLAVMPLWPDGEDWGTFVYLFVFFLAGYVLMSDGRLVEAVRRDLGPAFGVAILVDVVMLATGVPELLGRWQEAPSYSWPYAWSFLLVAVQAWAWVHVILGLGMRARSFRRPLPRCVGAAAMPFFLVHQPVVLAVAFVVVRWDIGLGAKWVMILAASFVVAAGLAVALARLPLVSTLFGVKPRPEAARGVRGRGEAAATHR